MRHEGELKDVSIERPMPWRQRQDFDETMKPLLATMLTPYVALSELAFVAQSYPALALPEPVERLRLKRAELDAIKSITGHEYAWLEYAQIEGDDFLFPFVRGVRGSHSIDSWSMSSSEFWVHYVLWCMHSANEHEVVLIDEPETFLAQPGHRPFIDEIARLTLKSKCQTVLVTHSEAIMRRVPRECVRLVTTGPNGASSNDVRNVDVVLRTLSRHRTPLLALIFVEDELATRILQAVLHRFAADRVDQFDIVDSGGKDEVLAATRVAGRSRRIKVLGVLDADQRAAELVGDVLFLPGRTGPETALVESLRSQPGSASEALGVHESDLLFALEATRFVSHQRVFDEIAQSLGLSAGELVADVSIGLWMEQADVAADARMLAEQLIAAIESGTA
ncbi:ATP-binding protein [Mycolicibacterium sp. P9-22]|uniref:ATP-binding protein n=1 Tax=Mycolicibacterium sp. P9-22 TaxID=2024613 RepID=UPI0011EEC0EC|nr:ATP-binding protein [Mycolicibacterium sp. P9-22]KAA0113073.1 hypothetical protein CIW51_25585 [Mycolicibacterium sp. P9-22]